LLILASSSPRRIEILTGAGIPFRVVEPGIDERPARALSPLRLACWAARRKAEAVARRYPEAVVLGADTVVALDGRSYGKPESDAQGRAILTALAGRTHLVYTAVVVVDSPGRRARQGFSRTQVTMRAISPAEIRAYVRRGEAQDKAGAYAIQGEGRRLVAAIRGPYDNVVGLPMHLVLRLLQACGIAMPVKNSNEGRKAPHDPPPPPARAADRRTRRVGGGDGAGGLRPDGQLSPHDHAEHRRGRRS